MNLISEQQTLELLRNGERTRAGDDIDPYPVVKLFNPLGLGTWLLTELDPLEPDMAFGLCDLGYPELGSVYLPELVAVRLPFGRRIERDRNFRANKSLSAYAAAARAAGTIVA